MTDQPFWRTKKLAEMTRSEWESLCDGCGRCCLIKLRDEDTDEVYFSDVACHLLNLHTCRCGNYKKRTEFVPDCVTLTADTIGELDFMPSTCAYRLLANGKELPDWHPLVTGKRSSVHKAGISVRYRAISEEEVSEADLPAHIVDWPR